MRTRPVILFLIDELCGPAGGTEQHLLWLLRSVPEKEYEKLFVVVSKSGSFKSDPLPIAPDILSRTVAAGRHNWGVRMRGLARLICERRVNLVHSFCLQSERIAAASLLLAGRGVMLGSRRNTGYALRLRDRAISRLVRYRVAGYVANSEAARNAAAQLEGIPLRKITTIGNPLIPDRVSDGLSRRMKRSELGLAEDDLVVGMVATIRPVKDHVTFLRAARVVADRIPRFRIVLIGTADPTCLDMVRRTARDLRLEDRILIPGSVDNAFRVLPCFDVAVLSSQSESFSNAVLEYAAAGLPSVVTDVGGLRELIHDGKGGFVVPSGDHASMADRILTLLHNRDLRLRFGDYSREHVRLHFSEERILGEYCNLYNRLCQSSSGCAG